MEQFRTLLRLLKGDPQQLNKTIAKSKKIHYQLHFCAKNVMYTFMIFVLLLKTIINHEFLFSSETIEEITTTNTTFPATIIELQLPV